jgi:hypothetical protein
MCRRQIAGENQWRIISNNLRRHNIRLIHGEASLKNVTALWLDQGMEKQK